MTEKCSRAQPNDGLFAHIKVRHLSGIDKRLAAGDYVSAEELAEQLRKNGDEPIPPRVFDYLCRMLEGKVAKPKGRTGMREADRRRWHMIIGGLYRLRFEYLMKRKQKHGHHAGWTKIEYPPAELAARLVARYFYYGEASWRTVQNIASSQK